MTWLEVYISIWGGTYVPRRKDPPPPDRAEGRGWIFGLVILVTVVLSVLAKLMLQ